MNIISWIKNPGAPHICWLSGEAGTGKSTIAKTVCTEAKKDTTVVLGGSFFCSRSSGLAAQRDVRCVVPTLARLFALQSAEFRQALAKSVESDPDLRHKEISVQIEQLLHTPLLALAKSCVPVLFVIDGLDECGGESFLDGHRIVTSLLEGLVTLTQTNPELPIKFLVSSRPEPHIRDSSITNDQNSLILHLHEVNKDEVDSDISQYIRQTVAMKLPSKPWLEHAISESGIERLVQLCDGLFIVAATALEHTFDAGADAAEARFTKLLNDSGNNLNPGAAAPLDCMYQLILEDATREHGPEGTELQAMLRLLASLLSARMSLSIASLADLLDLKLYQVRASLSLLHAVVYVPEGNDTPGLRTVHASFGDYLLSRAPDDIRISRSLGHNTLASACLDTMRRHLRFNISQSSSSYKPNSSTRPDSITLSVEYSCLHWAHHVAAAVKPKYGNAPTRSIFDVRIDKMFRPNLLFWLEVLSVLRKVSLASALLLIAASDVS